MAKNEAPYEFKSFGNFTFKAARSDLGDGITVVLPSGWRENRAPTESQIAYLVKASLSMREHHAKNVAPHLTDFKGYDVPVSVEYKNP